MADEFKARAALAGAEGELAAAERTLRDLRLKHSLTGGAEREIRDLVRLRDIRRKRVSKRMVQLAEAEAEARMAAWESEGEPTATAPIRELRETLRREFLALAADDAVGFLRSRSGHLDDLDYRRGPDTCELFRATVQDILTYLTLTGRAVLNGQPVPCWQAMALPDFAALESWAQAQHPEADDGPRSCPWAPVPPMVSAPPVPELVADECEDLDEDDPDTDLVAVGDTPSEEGTNDGNAGNSLDA